MKKRPSGCALGCGVLLLTCMALTLFYFTIWGKPKKRAQPVNMYDLVVDVSAFPQGRYWHQVSGPLPPPERKRLRDEDKGLYATFGWGAYEMAQHEVLYYKNELQATFSFYTLNEFPRFKEMVTPWAVPEGWTYRSPVADRFKFACCEIETEIMRGRMRQISSCTAVAQYDEYISIFTTPVSPTAPMTLEDLERVLRAIDERMAQHLKDDTR